VRGDLQVLSLGTLDFLAFGGYFIVLSVIGYLAGRRERSGLSEYFLAGRALPWYVVGTSFIASNISSEHFIGMIGAAFIYGACVSMSCWGNINSFTILIWFFIPFLLASRVFTIPEFMERRFNAALRQVFAFVTVASNIVAFLAAVLYGGGIALQSLFGWPLWTSIVVLGGVAGIWAIYGGLSSVAWTDFFTVIVMIACGAIVTYLGLRMLAGESGSVLDGFRVMIERNRADGGVWAEAVAATSQEIARTGTYDRLSVIQPMSHQTTPWPSLILGVFSVSLWYNVMNQFMIQRVLGAKNMYHARMGIVLAGFMQILLPLIIVAPGLILFARFPGILTMPWSEIHPHADKAYVTMIQLLVPAGLRGIILASLFGAIQSTVNSVLNSTATIITLDVYKRLFRPDAGDRHLVRVGIVTSVVVLAVAMALAGLIGKLGSSLFVYIQTMYAFFAPPFAAVFLLGILWRRINGTGATAAVLSGFVFYLALKAFVFFVPSHPAWMEPYGMQAAISWAFCVIVCLAVSLATLPPPPDRVTDQLVLNWRKLNILDGLGDRWYASVVMWWGLFAATVIALVIVFSGLVL